MFSISYPTSNSTVLNSFDASGSCSMPGGAGHTISAKLNDNTGRTIATGSTSHDASSWIANFTNVPNGTYTLVVTCGVAAQTATGIKVGT